jgi:hypothetical protein
MTQLLPSHSEKSLTLFGPILLHHVWLARSSSSLPMLSLPSLSTDCLSFPPPGGPGPPSPLPPSWPYFPQVPGSGPLPRWAQAELALYIAMSIMYLTNIRRSGARILKHWQGTEQFKGFVCKLKIMGCVCVYICIYIYIYISIYIYIFIYINLSQCLNIHKLSVPKFYAHLSESYFKVSNNSVSVLVQWAPKV